MQSWKKAESSRLKFERKHYWLWILILTSQAHHVCFQKQSQNHDLAKRPNWNNCRAFARRADSSSLAGDWSRACTSNLPSAFTLTPTTEPSGRTIVQQGSSWNTTCTYLRNAPTTTKPECYRCWDRKPPHRHCVSIGVQKRYSRSVSGAQQTERVVYSLSVRHGMILVAVAIASERATTT